MTPTPTQLELHRAHKRRRETFYGVKVAASKSKIAPIKSVTINPEPIVPAEPIPLPVVNRRAFARLPESMRLIASTVAKFYEISPDDFMSDKKFKEIARARHVAFYLTKTLTMKSSPDIGRRFGRDHTTVLYGARKIERLLEADQRLRDKIDIIKLRINEAMSFKEVAQ